MTRQRNTTVAMARPSKSAARSLLILLLIAFGVSTLSAAPRIGLETSAVSELEIVVFETQGCLVCRLFRRDVAPRYRASPRHDEAPLRFVDLGRDGARAAQLKAPLTIVPTAVIMQGQTEIARIEGYTGPEPFFQIIAHLFRDID